MAAWCSPSSSNTATKWRASRPPPRSGSWERSLHSLSAGLVQAGLDQVEVLVEYQLPLTNKRADIVLCGHHPRTNQPSYVVVEQGNGVKPPSSSTRSTCALCRDRVGPGRTPARALERSRRGARKQAIVVVGGPGSGKSVIALSLLGELSRQGRSVLHATGSSALTQTLRKVAGRRAPRMKAMFRYFNQFGDLEPNELDVLLCDEAHRVRETSANRYPRADARTGTPQVDELLQAARVPVFLLDGHQVVRPGELGSLSEISLAAARLGIHVECVQLDGQYRCGGSRAYETWVLRLRGLEPGGALAWVGDDHFDLQLAESAEHMQAVLRRREEAGCCWPWGAVRSDGSLPEDVVVGEWRRPWNNTKDTSVGGAPGRPYWSSDPAGFGQVGCVYTAQRFEYDWSGVILGADLIW